MKSLTLAALALALAVPSDAQKFAPEAQPSMPALQALPAKGADGYAPGVLATALATTAKNLDTIIDFLGRFDKDATRDEKWAEEAQALLVSQSAIADDLVAQGDKAIAAGIPRAEKDGPLDSYSLGYASRATFIHKDGGVALLQRDYASAQTNVVGHMAGLIRVKALHTPQAATEEKFQGWLDGARQSAEAARGRLMAAREKAATERVRKRAEKAGLRSSSTLDDE